LRRFVRTKYRDGAQTLQTNITLRTWWWFLMMTMNELGSKSEQEDYKWIYPHNYYLNLSWFGWWYMYK